MSYVTFDSNSGGSPPTISLPGSSSTWTTMTPAQLNSTHCLAHLRITNPNATVNLTAFGARQTGQAGYTQTYVLNTATHQCDIYVPLDANGHFDLFMSSISANLTLWLVGAWTNGDFTAVTPTAISVTTSQVAQSLNTLVGAPAGTQAGLFSGSLYAANIIKNGSTDAFGDTNESTEYRSWIVGCDGSQNVSFKTSTANTIYCHGYFNKGLWFRTNSILTADGTAGSNQNLAFGGTADGGPGSPIAMLYDFKASVASLTCTISEQGSGLSIGKQLSAGRHSQMIAAAPSQANISATTLTIYELGYFYATSSGMNGALEMMGMGA